MAFDDIAMNDHHTPTVIKLHLHRSKTVQFGRGIDVYVGRRRDGLCPVTAILAYLARRKSDFSPLFRMRDGRFLTKEVFTVRLGETLSTVRYKAAAYVGHNIRIGAATMAAEWGMEGSVV